MTQLTIKVLTRDEARAYVDDLARLRITVFRDYPYLYEGSVEYEYRYLETYLKSPQTVIALAFAGTKIVGATTGLPLKDEEEQIRNPFLQTSLDPKVGFYFGESVLLKEWRGHHVGRQFFEIREAAARACGCKFATFCSVIRPDNHPAKPKTYKPHDVFWKKMGFQKQEGLTTTYSWRDVGDSSETNKQMQYWVKILTEIKTA